MQFEAIGLVSGAAFAVQPCNIGIGDVEQAVKAIGTAIVEMHEAKRHWDPKSMPEGESTRQHLGGYTSLSALALITAGYDSQASPLREAIGYLQDIEPDGTYAVSFRAQVWASLPDRFLPLLQRDVDRLIESFHWGQGGWDYLCRPVKRIPRVSPSTRHVAVLALHAAAQRGIDIPRPLLQRVEQATIESQHEDGGWSYYTGDSPTGSMTSAGVFSLILVDELLAQHGRRTANARRDASIARGLAWLDARFEAMPCPGGGRCAKFPMYWLYSLERVALATGRRTLNTRDWMRDAVAVVLERLCRKDDQGVWHIKGRQSLSQLRQRCFALMILHRASLPLACSHLSIDDDESGGRLAATLVSTLLTRHEQESSWQRVSMDDTVDAWLESPLLLVAAKSAPRFLKPHYGAIARHKRSPDTDPLPSIQEVDRIREFVRRGGLLVVAAQSSGSRKAWKQIGSLAAPNATWAAVDREHPAMNLLATSRRRPRIESLSNGGRPLIFIVSSHFEAALPNLWAFATERHPFPPRLELITQTPPPAVTTPRLPIVFATSDTDAIEHGAAAALHDWAQRAGKPLEVHTVDLDRLSTTRGLLVIQAAAGPPPWQVINRLLGNGRSVLLTGSHEALQSVEVAVRDAGLTLSPARGQAWISGEGLPDGHDVSRPGWRPNSRQLGRMLPGLDMLVADHPAGGSLLVSHADLMQALLDRPSWGIHGYDARTARLLLWNLVQQITPTPVQEVAYLDEHATMGVVDNGIGRSDRGHHRGADVPGI